MKLTILGCSGSVPGPDSAASGYLITEGDTRVVLDLGNGTLGALQRFADPLSIDAVLLSHLHPDHCADVAALTVLRRYHPAARERAERLPLVAPAEAPSRLAALYAASSAELAEADLSDVFEFRPPPETPVRIGPIEVRAVPVQHVAPAWGFRVEAGGRVLAYTGDTGPCDGLHELAQNADVLLAEASWPDSADAPDGVHLSGRQAAEVAKGGNVDRLLLTHLQPWTDHGAVLDEATASFGGEVALVEAGREYRV